MLVSLLLAAAAVVSTGAATCASDLDCSLNGVCTAGACTCDAPWTGPRCGLLAFSAASPAAGRDLYPINDTQHNTWNGPIVGPVDGIYHMYLPLYPRGLLYHPTQLLHGTAPALYGPWAWQNLTGVQAGINPGALVFNDTKTGKSVYSLWVSGVVYVADAPGGPFTVAPGSNATGCTINASPLFHGGAFYCTGQKGAAVMTAPQLGGPWTVYAEIGAAKPSGTEDPFLWVDARGNWHALYHAANASQLTHCGSSRVSAHVFSADDGRTWHELASPSVEPYKPMVTWTDGVKMYATVERPHAYFYAGSGRMTHLGLAADLVTGDEGCALAPNCHPKRQQGHCPCCNCKYLDHAGTILVALGDP